MDKYLFWIALGAVVSGIGLLVQGLSSFGLYRKIRKLQEQIAPLIPQAQETLQDARATIKVTRERVEEIAQKASASLDLVNRQLVAFDQTRGEFTERLRVQTERLELVLDDSLSRVQDVVGTLHRGVIRPVKEVAGLLAGIRAGVETFLRGRRPSVAEATHDDELFI